MMRQAKSYINSFHDMLHSCGQRDGVMRTDMKASTSTMTILRSLSPEELMSLGDRVFNWITSNPLLTVIIMAAAEFCAIFWFASVYLA